MPLSTILSPPCSIELSISYISAIGFPGGSDGKASAYNAGETRVRSLGQEDPLEKEIATHSSTLAWKIPWTEEPGRLQSTGSQSWTRLSDVTFFLSFYVSHEFKQVFTGVPL